MIKPWDLKTEEERSVDSIYTFLIFCEDETSELEYFNWFETDDIKINVIPKQKSMMSNVIKAISHCRSNGIIDENSDVVEGYEVWCVYDRDRDGSADILRELENNTEFRIAHEVAESHKINLAWSNDAFELWILLHIKEINQNYEDFKSRDKYYEFLSDYFSNHPNPNERLIKVLSHPSFSYKKDLKHRTNFKEIVRNEILVHTNTAIVRAEELYEFQKDKSANYEDWNPCTLVYTLVVRLIEKGGKQLPLV